MVNFSTKITSTVGMVALLATTMSASLVSAASEFLPYAEVLADNDVIGAQSTEAGYRLGDTVTRAELAKVTANLGGYTPTSCGGDVYSDVSSTLGDLCGYIEALAEAGVVSTANANFRPTASVTRAEMVKMLLGAVGETGSDTFAGYTDVANLGDLTGFINRANELGCAADATYFRPNATSTRGEAFKIAACVAGLEITPGTGTGSTNSGVTNTGVVAGKLTVALNGTAAAQYVPKNASSVKVGTVKLTAGDKDVTVASLTVARSGLGNAQDILTSQGIRAAQNGVVISSSSDFYNSTSQKGNVYFYPALTIKAGTSQDVDVLVNLNGAENSQHQFTLDSVNAGASSVSGAPITLGLLNTTSYVTSTVKVSNTNYGYSVNPGKVQQIIAKVDLTAGNRDVKVNGFTLTRSGSNDLTKKFANVTVFKNGVKVGNGSLTSDKLSVTGLSEALAAGNFQAFEIKADILVDGSSSSNVVGFKVESTSDVAATEVATGYNTSTDGVLPTAPTVSTVTINKVDVTYSKQSTKNETVAPGASNVILFNAKVKSSVALNIRQLVITPTGTNSGVYAFANDQLSVKVNGSEVATITTAEFGTGAPSAITKTVSIPVDSTTDASITIVGSSVKNNVSGSLPYTFQVKLSDVRDSANNTVGLVTDAVTGDKTTIQAPTLTLKNATVAAPTNSTLSSVSNQEAGRFGLTADGDAVRITKVVLTATMSTGSLTDVIDSSSIELRDVATDAKISGTVTLSGNVVTIDSINNDIAKDTTQNLKIILTSVKTLDNLYGATLTFAVTTGDLTTTTVNGGTSVTLNGNAGMKPYTIGVVPPAVLVTANSPLTQNAKVATVRFTNNDSNTGITLSGLVLTFSSRYSGQGNLSYTANLCLRDLGSSESCGVNPGTTAAQAVTQAGGTFTFAITGSTLANATNVLTKNGGYSEFEVYLDNAPLWVAGDNVNVTVKSVNYNVGATSSTQSYVGVSGASATATK